MANLTQWINELVDDYEIEAVVIGEPEWEAGRGPEQARDIVLSWEEAKPMLDYEFAESGGPDCNPVYVWTKTQILYVAEYDGSTKLTSVPRNPISCTPEFT